MDGFVLRIIAMSTMLIDHIGWNFLDEPMTLTWIGRIAFPVYAFLLAEGFLHVCGDRNRLNKHLSIMLILTVLSEPAYNLLESRLDFADYPNSQSNMITLLLGYLGMLATEAFFSSTGEEKHKVTAVKVISLICVYGLLGFGNYMLKGNFNIVGPLLVVAFYWFIRMMKEAEKQGSKNTWLKRICILLGVFLVYLCIYFWVRSGFGDAARWWKEVVDYAPWIAGHALAAVVISLYNGKLGYHKKWFTRLYLSFYPIHAAAIGIICTIIGR